MTLITQDTLSTKSREELCGLLKLAFHCASTTKRNSPQRRRALAAMRRIQAELGSRGPTP